jgi:endoglycosylceramidase
MSFHLYTLSPAQEPAVLANAGSWSSQTGGALLNTEWGAVTTSSDIERQSVELDTALLPWIFWSMGEVVNNPALPPSGSNLITSTVDALIQPYPLAVAGTPERLDYSPAARSLTFRWSTVRPGGGTYPPNTRTVIEAPATVYPDGYRVIVYGGRVTSAPCSSLISVVGTTGARRIVAHVVPDHHCGT